MLEKEEENQALARPCTAGDTSRIPSSGTRQ